MEIFRILSGILALSYVTADTVKHGAVHHGGGLHSKGGVSDVHSVLGHGSIGLSGGYAPGAPHGVISGGPHEVISGGPHDVISGPHGGIPGYSSGGPHGGISGGYSSGGPHRAGGYLPGGGIVGGTVGFGGAVISDHSGGLYRGVVDNGLSESISHGNALGHSRGIHGNSYDGPTVHTGGHIHGLFPHEYIVGIQSAKLIKSDLFLPGPYPDGLPHVAGAVVGGYGRLSSYHGENALGGSGHRVLGDVVDGHHGGKIATGGHHGGKVITTGGHHATNVVVDGGYSGGDAIVGGGPHGGDIIVGGHHGGDVIVGDAVKGAHHGDVIVGSGHHGGDVVVGGAHHGGDIILGGHHGGDVGYGGHHRGLGDLVVTKGLGGHRGDIIVSGGIGHGVTGGIGLKDGLSVSYGKPHTDHIVIGGHSEVHGGGGGIIAGSHVGHHGGLKGHSDIVYT